MPGSAGAQRAQLLHTGAGVARRDAHHARRADERLVLEEVDTEAALGAEEATLTIVRVEAGSVVVEADGANYAPLVKRESKKERRARQQEDAREQQKAAATAPPTTVDGGGAVAAPTPGSSRQLRPAWRKESWRARSRGSRWPAGSPTRWQTRLRTRRMRARRARRRW